MKKSINQSDLEANTSTGVKCGKTFMQAMVVLGFACHLKKGAGSANESQIIVKEIKGKCKITMTLKWKGLYHYNQHVENFGLRGGNNLYLYQCITLRLQLPGSLKQRWPIT